MVIEIVADVRIVVIITGPIAYNSHHIRAEEIPVYSTGVNEIFSIIRSIVPLVEAELSQARLSEEDEKVSKRQRRYLSSGEYQISDILNHFWLIFLFQD